VCKHGCLIYWLACVRGVGGILLKHLLLIGISYMYIIIVQGISGFVRVAVLAYI
jgi:hypothetical protein